MKYYEKLLELGCFTRDELIELTGSDEAANYTIYQYLKKGYIERVKRDLYVAISLETKQPVLSRYQIGCRLFPDACISHHSAFEVYGYSNQVFYETYVATESQFLNLEYDGITYRRVDKKEHIDIAIIGMVRVTSIEQTVIDSIRDFEKIAGLEEVARCIMLVPSMKEERLLECLERNQNGFLYQKSGYIFEQLQDTLGLSDAFYEECIKCSSKSKRYLMKERDNTVWNERWRLYAPESLQSLLDKGVSDYDAI